MMGRREAGTRVERERRKKLTEKRKIIC